MSEYAFCLVLFCCFTRGVLTGTHWRLVIWSPSSPHNTLSCFTCQKHGFSCICAESIYLFIFLCKYTLNWQYSLGVTFLIFKRVTITWSDGVLKSYLIGNTTKSIGLPCTLKYALNVHFESTCGESTVHLTYILICVVCAVFTSAPGEGGELCSKGKCVLSFLEKTTDYIS